MLLLKEFSTFEYKQEDVKKEDGKLIVRGILQRADTLNQNGRIYPREILEREIMNYQKLIRENRALGECDHADSPVVELKHVSHVIRECHFEGDVVYGTVEILPTPCGSIVKALVESGIKVGISSRGVGSVSRRGDANIVQDDFQLICWDFVSEPSTPGAFMMTEAINENTLKKVFTRSDRIDRIANEILSLKGKK
jgi:hypothetical protein